jgi:hypothetical protein
MNEQMLLDIVPEEQRSLLRQALDSKDVSIAQTAFLQVEEIRAVNARWKSTTAQADWIDLIYLQSAAAARAARVILRSLENQDEDYTEQVISALANWRALNSGYVLHIALGMQSNIENAIRGEFAEA